MVLQRSQKVQPLRQREIIRRQGKEALQGRHGQRRTDSGGGPGSSIAFNHPVSLVSLNLKQFCSVFVLNNADIFEEHGLVLQHVLNFGLSVVSLGLGPVVFLAEHSGAPVSPQCITVGSTDGLFCH